MGETINLKDYSTYKSWLEEAAESVEEEAEDRDKSDVVDEVADRYIGRIEDNLTILTYSTNSLSGEWNVYVSQESYDGVIKGMAYDKFRQDLQDEVGI